jgi:hypothetical protein
MDQEGGSLASIIGSFGNSDSSIAAGGWAATSCGSTSGPGAWSGSAGLAWPSSSSRAGGRFGHHAGRLGGNDPSFSRRWWRTAGRCQSDTGKVTLGCAYGTELTGVNTPTPVTFGSATAWAAKLAIENRCGP